ncbi:MAG: hypothetical protein DRI24_09490 [Deltaproteobacteria bacterium]|nr:MAG: hypothetical protein DRI24_09490 [Deltaproteobacteria bacterium]
MKIISIEKTGKKQTYNLTMRSKHHNYILESGIVSANSHGVAYSVTSFQTAWLKTYYPKEFFTALLMNSLEKQDDTIKYINSSRENDIPIERPSVNRSSVNFTLDNGTVLFGLMGIKGIGEKDAAVFVAARPEEGFLSLQDMIAAKINKKTLTALAECGALEEVSDLSRRQLIDNLEVLIKHNKKIVKRNESIERYKQRNKDIQIAIHRGEKPPRKLALPKEIEELVIVPDKGHTYTKLERLQLEKQTLGFYLTGHPLDDYPNLMRVSKFSIGDLKNGAARNKDRIYIAVVLSKLIEKRTRKGKNMAVCMIEDRTGRIEGTIFPRQWAKIKNTIEEGKVSVVKATVEISQSEDTEGPSIPRLYVDSISQDVECGTEQMKVLVYNFPGKGEIKFTPSEDQDYNKWQQAAAIIKNLEEE